MASCIRLRLAGSIEPWRSDVSRGSSTRHWKDAQLPVGTRTRRRSASVAPASEFRPGGLGAGEPGHPQVDHLIPAAVLARLWWAADLAGASQGAVGEEQAIPEISRLIENGQYVAAFSLSQQAKQFIPVPSLPSWIGTTNRNFNSHESTRGGCPDEGYGDPEGEWQNLGQSPLENVRLPFDICDGNFARIRNRRRSSGSRACNQLHAGSSRQPSPECESAGQTFSMGKHRSGRTARFSDGHEVTIASSRNLSTAADTRSLNTGKSLS